MTGQTSGMTGDEIVISGISGRFPNSENIAEFQENLLNKVDCTTVEHERWNNVNPAIPQRIGATNNIEKFDRVFFGIHAKLADIMDPVSRTMLEHTYEAIMDAGINPRSLKDRKIAVYVTTNSSEAEKNIYSRNVQAKGFGIMGSSKAMMANRLSFFFGLSGTSSHYDGTDSGSAVALECAYNALKNGQCEGAIVAAAISILHPHISFHHRALGILSADGVTRCFDDNASGFTRSEGIGVLYLQRARDAKRIYMEVASVRTAFPSTCITQTVMYSAAEPQERLMKQTLNENGLSPDDISFLETSSIALKEVDTEILQAIDRVFSKRRKPIIVGSVMSNIGNAIPANNINAIIKMIIQSETGKIVPNLHYEKPNSKADCLKTGRVQIPTEVIPWSGKYVLINSIAFSGVIANILLKTPDVEKKNNGVPDDDLPRLVCVSGRTEESIFTLLNYMQSRPVDVELLQLYYDVFEAGIEGHLYRGFTILPAKGLPSTNTRRQEIIFNSGESREIWWVFSGMGSQWVGMGESLLKIPVFNAAIRKCDAILKPRGYDIYKIITDKDPKMFDNIINSFVGIAAIQIGLVDVLKTVGLEPDYIIGHSVGELGCAYADGCFTAEQMIMSALSRGLASKESDLIRGSMAAVGLGHENVKPLCPPDIDIACHNGPDSSTISGPAESMKKFVNDLQAKGIFAREVPCSNIAYHSRYIAPAGPKLLDYLQKVIPNPNPRSSKWVSTSVPRGEWKSLKARLCSAEYHTNNLLSSVLFDETSRLIPPNAICIEIAPHGLLQAILKKSLPPSCINIPLTDRRSNDNFEVLLSALGKLHNVGLQPKIQKLYPKIEYPVGRGTPSISSFIKWDHAADWLLTYTAPSDNSDKGEKEFAIDLHEKENKYLLGNVINGTVSIPLSLYLIRAWEVLKTFEAKTIPDIIFEDIRIHKLRLPVTSDNIVRFTVTVSKGNKKFEVFESENMTLLVTGAMPMNNPPSEERLNVRKSKHSEKQKYEFSNEDFYTEMKMRGFQYSGEFTNVLKSSIDGTSGLIKWSDNWVTFIDSALQLYAFSNDIRQVEVPLTIRKVIIDHKLHIAALRNSKDVQVTIDKKINYISVGGLEIQGLKFSTLPKTIEQNRFSSDVLNAVPNVDESNLPLANCLRLVLQLVLENSFSKTIQLIQLIKSDELQTIKAFDTVMKGIPEASLFKYNVIPYEKAKFDRVLTIITNDLKTHNFNETSKKLRNNKFLLTLSTRDKQDSYVKQAESAGLRVVLIRKAGNESLILFRKRQVFGNIHVLNASQNIKEIINKIKSIKISSEDDRIVIVIKSKDKINVTEFIDQLEENVNLEKIRIFNIQDPNVADNPFSDQFYKEQLELDLLMNILTPKRAWATLRRTAVTLNRRLCKSWSANPAYSYDPMSITWTEGPNIANFENVVKVECAAVNLQDVLIANGTFCSDPFEEVGKNRLSKTSLGLEFSGVDSKGNRVMGVTCGNSLSNVVNADAAWTWTIPKTWSFEDAATVPFSYLTAYSSFFIKADAQPGDRVMVSNCCDGTGLAILHLATHRKCDVFVVYETEAEKKLLQATFPNIPNNRLFKASGNNFKNDILLATKGQGVDVVICNQCEVHQLEEYLITTKRNARTVLISDLNENKIHGSIGMELFLREISFYSVVPKKVLLSDSENKKILTNMLKDGISTGCVKPLPRTIYKSDSLNEAFNTCVTRKSSGKIIVKVTPDGPEKSQALVAPRLACSNKKSYLIIEGLTAFGLELVDWLITRGARRFVIASTLKVDNGYKNLRLQLWQSYGIQIILRNEVDLSKQQNIQALFKEATSLGSIDAVFDLRRTDTTSNKSTSSNDSMNSTTKIADQESRSSCPELRFFVVCSVATNVGSLTSIKKLGQFNSIINSQNTVVEDVLERRKKDGLHGLLIRWGLHHSTKEYDNTLDTNIILPPVTKYLQEFDELLGIKEITVAVSYTVSSTNEAEEDGEIGGGEVDAWKFRKAVGFIDDLNAEFDDYGILNE